MPKTPFLLLLLTVATYAQPQPPLLDERDGKTYKTVQIGTQIWTAENLNYNAESSKCYDNKPENCKKYGRLYNWETALKSCPKSWHLPSDEEWQILVDFAGGIEVAGKKFKAKSVWNDYEGESGNGTDEYGFSALPGGYFAGSFSYVGYQGYWWSSSENLSSLAYDRRMYFNLELAYYNYYYKAGMYSVRCVQN